MRSAPRFLPGLVVLGCFWFLLHHAGIGDRQTLLFLLTQLVAYVVPGTLGWRVLRGSRDPALADPVFGTIAMHALMVPGYVVVRWLGVPHLVWAIPVLVAGAALVAARYRRVPLTGGPRLPGWVPWNGALAIGLGLVLIGNRLPATTEPLRRWPGTDNPFLLSLAGELKHHVPPAIPYVNGESLDYHWFSFADMAAMSWLSGQELDLIVLVLVPLGLLALGLLGFGLLGWKVTGSPVAGVVALWLAVVVGSVSALGTFDSAYVVDGTFLQILWIPSVTQGFAQVLCVALLYLLTDLLRSRRPGAGTGVLFVLLTFAITGGKASFVPVLGAGAALALLVALRRGGPRARVLVLGVVLALALVFAQVVLFHGASAGMAIDPGESLGQMAASMGIGDPGTGGRLLVLVFLLVGWLLPLIAAGALLLGERRSRVADDPILWWLLGMVVAAMLVVPLFRQPGFSQYFFLRVALPFAYLGVAAGLVQLWGRSSRVVRVAAPGAAVLGLVLVLLLRSVTDSAAPRGVHDLAVAIAVPVLAVPVVAVLAVLLARTGPRLPAVLLVTGALTLGMGAARTWQLTDDLLASRPPVAGPSPIPAGGIEAARWVRAHSGTDDLIATNAHCWVPGAPVCRTYAHWISAWTERHTVVQGWAYTRTANKGAKSIIESTSTGFWDPALLALNDRVFTDPGRPSLDALRARQDVRWLIVDRRFPVDLAGLRALLPEHRRFGQVTVFRVPG